MKKNRFSRIFEYAAGIIILCLGVVLNTKTGLGVACINTIPYSMSQISSLSLGTCTFFLYCIFIIAQCLVLHRIKIKTLLQLPVSLLFGVLVDWINRSISFMTENMLQGFLMLVTAIALTALGTVLMVEAEMIPAAPDGMVQAVSGRMNWGFGKTKMCFDLFCVAITFIYTTLLAGHQIGIGIGTVAAMFLTGNMCSLWRNLLNSGKQITNSDSNHLQK